MDKLTRILSESQYVLLTTFRRNGKPVSTPVWVVGDGSSLAVWTSSDSGKARRVQRDGAVELAPCEVRGKPFGRSVRGRARLLDKVETERVERLLKRKYGLVGRTLLAIGRSRREQPHTALSITVD